MEISGVRSKMLMSHMYAPEANRRITYPKSPLMCEKRPRFCEGYHFTGSGWLGMLLMGTTTLPKKLLLLPVPLFLSFWIVISKSPGSIESSGTRNSNCTSKAISLRLIICRTSLMQKTRCAMEQECLNNSFSDGNKRQDQIWKFSPSEFQVRIGNSCCICWYAEPCFGGSHASKDLDLNFVI